MNRRVKRTALSALTALAAAVSLTVATAPQASAINMVDCGLREDYLKIYAHDMVGGNNREWCYANAGTTTWTGGYLPAWLVHLSSGNNVVQWHGDGRWQPDAPIGKWTLYTFPNHPGGVRIDGLRIH